MRLSLIAGILLVLIGAYVVVRGGSYGETHDVVKVGDIHVTDSDRHPIPPWAGGAIALAGVAVIVAGARKRP